MPPTAKPRAKAKINRKCLHRALLGVGMCRSPVQRFVAASWARLRNVARRHDKEKTTASRPMVGSKSQTPPEPRSPPQATPCPAHHPAKGAFIRPESCGLRPIGAVLASSLLYSLNYCGRTSRVTADNKYLDIAVTEIYAGWPWIKTKQKREVRRGGRWGCRPCGRSWGVGVLVVPAIGVFYPNRRITLSVVAARAKPARAHPVSKVTAKPRKFTAQVLANPERRLAEDFPTAVWAVE